MDLSICIVSWNTRDLLRRCIESIGDTIDGLDHEIIVIDNASSDDSAQLIAREFPGVHLIQNSDNRGFARANNQGIAVSRGRHVLLLNSDAVLLPGAAREMVEFLDAHPKVGIVGARLLNADGSFQASFADFPSLLGETLLATGLARHVFSPVYPSYSEERSGQERSVDWIFGACMMVRRAAIELVGPLDEDYFMYTEETDWCYRMRQGGWAVYYLPTARVKHWSGQSSNTAPIRKRSQLYRSKWLFLRKRRGTLRAGAFAVTLRVASALKLGLWAIRSLSPRPDGRKWARQQAQSYVLLLREL